jgi:hypothetical protein
MRTAVLDIDAGVVAKVAVAFPPPSWLQIRGSSSHGGPGVDKSNVLAFGRNGYVLFSGGNWDEVRPHMKRLWEQSAMAREARWDAVESLVHTAWLASAAAFARARLKAHARQRTEAALWVETLAPGQRRGAPAR